MNNDLMISDLNILNILKYSATILQLTFVKLD